MTSVPFETTCLTQFDVTKKPPKNPKPKKQLLEAFQRFFDT